MATYNSYNSYLAATGLIAKNPALKSAILNGPTTFLVMPGPPYSNSPNRLSSSWIKGAVNIPSTGSCLVNCGNKMYPHVMSDYELGRWLTSRSLGSYFNTNMKLK